MQEKAGPRLPDTALPQGVVSLLADSGARERRWGVGCGEWLALLFS